MGDNDAVPVRPQPIAVHDEFSDLRKGLKSKARLLQKFLNFEAAVRPHIERQQKEIAALREASDDQEKQIARMEEELKRDADAVAKELTEEERLEKLDKIRQLEANYVSLLEEKAFYLSRATDLPEGDAAIEFPEPPEA
jgi:hypothetical protein